MQNFYLWVPFYEELGQKLSAYKDKRTALLDWIYSDLASDSKYMHDSNGNRLKDIDPFSVMGIFNRHITEENKNRISQKFKDYFKIDKPCPTTFRGVTPLTNENSLFFGFKDDKLETDIDNLWEIFCQATKDPKQIGPLFDEMTTHQYGIKFNLTIGLYWIQPNFFFPLDAPSRKILVENGIEVGSKVPSFKEYLDILSQLQEKFKKDGVLQAHTFPSLTRAIYFTFHKAK